MRKWTDMGQDASPVPLTVGPLGGLALQVLTGIDSDPHPH